MFSTHPDPNFIFYFLSEEAVTIQFGTEINEDSFDRINEFYDKLIAHPFQGFIDAVRAYTTLTVFYNPTVVMSSSMPVVSSYQKVTTYLAKLHRESYVSDRQLPRRVTIPVCYSGSLGPDLVAVATYTNLTVEEVIALHSEAVYKVFMIGFIPGFAYLGGMNERLAMPRKETPRKQVPAGAVGIAGNQTGIYPIATPGGWQILGETPLQMFSIDRKPPPLLKAGDEVVFKPVSLQEFETLKASSHADNYR